MTPEQAASVRLGDKVISPSGVHEVVGIQVFSSGARTFNLKHGGWASFRSCELYDPRVVP